ncbi:MAG: glycosyltransferase [Propionibacteriaceae bacterium]|nr:glycosyltransferase [Propionibacteriaceae bacterium]
MSVSADEWAWARREDEDAPPVVGHAKVTAILVVHNGQDWLPATLKSMADLDQRPGRLIVINAGSTDESATLLQQAYDNGIVSKGRLARHVIDSVATVPALGFTRVVNDMVASLPPDDGWVWLLHDDSAPRADCLTELLRVATSPDGVSGPAIVIPKLLRPKLRHRPDQVQSVGEAVSIGGARVVAAEAGDVDQQQDESTRALGASTAGLLVRRDAWVALGGLSPQLPGFRSGVDLGWRANESGMAVKTAPDATLRHQQAGLTGLRLGAEQVDPEVEDLVAGLRVAISHSEHPNRASWRARVANRVVWVGAWLAKDSNQAHLRAATLKRFRCERAETAELTSDVQREPVRRVPKALLPAASWGLKNGLDSFSRRFIRQDDGDSEISLDVLTSDEETVVAAPRRRQSLLGLGSAVVLAIATMLACRMLLGFSPLTSYGLAPAPGSLGDAWRAWLQPTGQAGANAPWLAIMAFGSTLMGGQPGWWASVLVLGGVFLAAWSAYRFVRVFIGPTATRIGLSLLWAVLLPVTGASSDGSPGWVMIAIALPWLACALTRWAKEPVKGLVGLRTPAAVALSLTLAAIVTPALWVAGVLAAGLVAWRVRDLRGWLISALGPLLVLGPWIPRLLSEPGRVLTGVDPALTRLIPAPDVFGILLGRVGLGASPPMWLGGAVLVTVWVIGLVSLVSFESERWRFWLLGGMALAVVLAVMMSRVTVTIAGEPVRAAILPWLLVAAIIAIGSTAAGWRPETPAASSQSGGADTSASAGEGRRLMIGTIVLIGAVLGAAWWMWGGEGRPLQRQSSVVPDYVMAAESSPRATRTLIVAVSNGQASVSLRDATSPTWGSGEQSPFGLGAADQAAVVAMAGQFADGFASDDLASRLAGVGIGHVVVIGVPQAAIDAMTGVPDLAGGTIDNTTVWTVGGLPSRALLVDGGTITPLSEGTVPAGGDGRELLLLEPSDLPWRVSVDSVQLSPAETSTQFQVPAAGGVLRWWLPLLQWALWWHIVALFVLIWAAMPASRAAERLAASEARRAVT